MTEDNTTPEQTDFMCDYAAKDRAFKALSTSLHVANKKTLFDALEAAGITSVLVHFDGYGDSGQVEDIDAVSGDQPRDLPTGTVVIARAHWGTSETEQAECSVRDAVEALAYAFLEETHGGWENNQGAYGEFTFTVANRSIVLDYNERFESSEYSQHLF